MFYTKFIKVGYIIIKVLYNNFDVPNFKTSCSVNVLL